MAVVFWNHCFDTVKMVCPRIGAVLAGYIINEPNTEAVDGAGCCYNAGRELAVQLAFIEKVLSILFGGDRSIVAAGTLSMATAVGGCCRTCVLCHRDYLKIYQHQQMTA